MSDDRIYVRFKGKTIGPLSEQKVQSLIKRGQITRMHELSSDGLAWMRAEEFRGMFQAVPSQAASATPSGNGAPAVEATTASGPATMPRPGEAAESGVEWYAHIAGENQGPLNSSRIFEMIESGHVRDDTLVWRPGYEDWQTAAQSFPELFERNSHPFSASHLKSTVFGDGATGVAAPGTRAELFENFAQTRIPIRFLAISLLVFGGFSALHFVIVMIVGSESGWVPGQGSASVVYGLTGLVMTGVMIAGAILLLRYAASLKAVQRQSEPELIFASRRLRLFWKYCAIVMLVIEILLIGIVVMGFIMLTAVADSVT